MKFTQFLLSKGYIASVTFAFLFIVTPVSNAEVIQDTSSSSVGLLLAEHSHDDDKHHDKKHSDKKHGYKFKKMDTDGDGSISKDEFISGLDKKFSKMDKNNDGLLSKEEWKGAWLRKHKKHKEKS